MRVCVQESAEEFKCHVMYDDYNHQVELTMEVAISLQKNYEYIKVFQMNYVDIIHDFENVRPTYLTF